MVPYCFTIAPQIGQAMQGAVVRVARPEHQEDGVVPRGGRKAAAPGQADADAVEDHCAHHRPHGSAMLGKI